MTWLLEMKNITKTFGAVKAVDNVSLRLNAGEVVSLCGENGSGKSTLMKVLCGIYPHGSYEGEIIFAGETLQATIFAIPNAKASPLFIRSWRW
ncbi:D-xylose transport ATP-binding protein XylG [Klebsiella pneumoniae]|uniref:D-xylose transport ATP-binding protein XylG n=1 Tax=Klebsiella pneumoniae TaxID=573 RepID=A0A378B5T2_KLEPN|nr:D-xylose transport ATP-binding protein XylG [Klebsiella pneumoniae]